MNTTMNMLESFKRARFLDSLTSDDDKVTPVYKLDELCEIALSSNSDVVKEMVDYLVKNRLENRSPCVKFKVLRLFKYAVPKSGKDFKREVQRQSSIIRTFFQYRGAPDPLKGDAPNKAVRDMAHEAIQAIFSEESSEPTATSSQEKYPRMQAFGSSHSSKSSPHTRDDWRRVGSDKFNSMVGFSSETLKQGIEYIREAANQGGPGLSKSLTSDSNNYEDSQYTAPEDSYNPAESSHGESQGYHFSSTHEEDRQVHQGRRVKSSNQSLYLSPREEVGVTPWQMRSASEKRTNSRAVESIDSHQIQKAEEKLVEGITQAGGVRPLPSREALQAFLNGASRLDGSHIAAALERKLRNQLWQVRLRSMAVLEACLRNDGDPACDAMYHYFREDATAIVECLESPQASLREKSKRVYELLGLSENTSHGNNANVSSDAAVSPQPASVLQPLPDLLDTSETTATTAVDVSVEDKTLSVGNLGSPVAPASLNTPVSATGKGGAQDLLGDDFWSGGSIADKTTPQLKSNVADSQEMSRSFNGGDVPGSLGVSGVQGTDLFSNQMGEAADMFSGLQVDDSAASHSQNVRTAPSLTVGTSDQASELFEGLTVASGPSVSEGRALPTLTPSSSQGQTSSSYSNILQGYDTVPQGVQGVGQVPSYGGFPHPPTALPGFQLSQIQQQQQQLLLQQQLLYMQAAAALEMGVGASPSGPVGMRPNAAMMGGRFPPSGLGATYGAVAYAGPGISFSTGNMNPVASNFNLGGHLGNDFDFSGDPTVKIQPHAEVKKDESRAFDFIQEHFNAVNPRKQGSQ